MCGGFLIGSKQCGMEDIMGSPSGGKFKAVHEW